MSSIRLQYSVHTLEKRQLLPAGTLVTEDVLRDLISELKGSPQPLQLVLGYKSISDELRSFMSRGPYRLIFADDKRTATVLTLMAKVRLAPAILGSMDYFREYDFYTYRHILMVFALSTLLAQDLVENYQELLREITTGPIHDFGKICVPLQVLKKSDPLTRTERQILEHHAAAGFVLASYYLQDSGSLAAIVARDHHERKDGSGYPQARPLTDRLVEIVAASDIYDALISPRPYRPSSYDNRTALEEITELARQGKLSWEVVKALVAHNRQSKPDYRECSISLEKRGSPPPDNRYGLVLPDHTRQENSSSEAEGNSEKSRD